MKQLFIINVESIHENGLQLKTAWDAQTFEDILQQKDEGFKVCSPLNLNLSIALLGKKVILEGDLHTLLEVACVSCLIEFTQPLAIQFRYILWPQAGAMVEEGERELHEEDMDTGFYQGENIDLRPLVREQFFLALPQNPRCKEDCLGLCPKCGINLNEKRCECSPVNRQDESPFNVLMKLKRT